MYTYSDFTALIALNYTNKAQTEKNKNKNKKKPQENREKRQD